MTRSNWVTLLVMVAAMGVNLAHAEKADRTKKVEIEFDRALTNLDQSTVSVDGNVVLTQGTLKIVAPKMELKRDASKNVFAAMTGGETQRVTFREKREGFPDYTEGEADRAEFDQRANTVKLLSRARVVSAGNELTGEVILYNSLTEEFSIGRQAGGQLAPGTVPQRSKLVLPAADAKDKPAEKK